MLNEKRKFLNLEGIKRIKTREKNGKKKNKRISIIF
jgi:hypothetical protein